MDRWMDKLMVEWVDELIIGWTIKLLVVDGMVRCVVELLQGRSG